MKYVITYKTDFGTVSAESDDPNDLVGAYDVLTRLSLKIVARKGKTKPTRKGIALGKKHGHAETATVLRTVESRLIPVGFFSKSRTTGDTKTKLKQITGKSFTSRKISQALGILWKKGILRRTGTRNYFSYLAT